VCAPTVALTEAVDDELGDLRALWEKEGLMDRLKVGKGDAEPVAERLPRAAEALPHAEAEAQGLCDGECVGEREKGGEGEGCAEREALRVAPSPPGEAEGPPERDDEPLPEAQDEVLGELEPEVLADGEGVYRGEPEPEPEPEGAPLPLREPLPLRDAEPERERAADPHSLGVTLPERLPKGDCEGEGDAEREAGGEREVEALPPEALGQPRALPVRLPLPEAQGEAEAVANEVALKEALPVVEGVPHCDAEAEAQGEAEAVAFAVALRRGEELPVTHAVGVPLRRGEAVTEGEAEGNAERHAERLPLGDAVSLRERPPEGDSDAHRDTVPDTEGDRVSRGETEVVVEALPQALNVALREGEPLPLAQRDAEGEPEGERPPLRVGASLREAEGEREAAAVCVAMELVADADAQPDAEGEPLREPDCEPLALTPALAVAPPLRDSETVVEAEPDTGMLGSAVPDSEPLPLTLRLTAPTVDDALGETDTVLETDVLGVAEPPLPQPEGDAEGEGDSAPLREPEGEPDALRENGAERDSEPVTEPLRDAEAQCVALSVREAQEEALAVMDAVPLAEGEPPSRLPLALGDGEPLGVRRGVLDTDGEEEGLGVFKFGEAVDAQDADDEPLDEVHTDKLVDVEGEREALPQPLLLAVARTVGDAEGDAETVFVPTGVCDTEADDDEEKDPLAQGEGEPVAREVGLMEVLAVTVHDCEPLGDTLPERDEGALREARVDTDVEGDSDALPLLLRHAEAHALGDTDRLSQEDAEKDPLGELLSEADRVDVGHAVVDADTLVDTVEVAEREDDGEIDAEAQGVCVPKAHAGTSHAGFKALLQGMSLSPTNPPVLMNSPQLPSPEGS
jgi:hypothetical protein